MISEKPAKGVRGFLLWSPFDKQYFFRVYNENDRSQFTDYKINAEDIEIEILDDSLSLYEGQRDEFDVGISKNRLDWSQRTLKGAPGDKIVRVHRNKDGKRIEEHGHLDIDLKFVVDQIEDHIERNEFFGKIGIIPFNFADDESMKEFQDGDRKAYED